MYVQELQKLQSSVNELEQKKQVRILFLYLYILRVCRNGTTCYSEGSTNNPLHVRRFFLLNLKPKLSLGLLQVQYKFICANTFSLY